MSNAVAEPGPSKGNAFTGIWAGKGYLLLSKLFGFTRPFYERALGSLAVEGQLTALDLGCGPGVLAFALAKRLPPGSVVHGLDLSGDQIRYARKQATAAPLPPRFSVGSMDELPFADASLDLVVTSMALHEAAPEARRKAVTEVARVLKPAGRFLLVDWSKPRFGFWAAVWFPFLVFGENNRDNWNNVYAGYCRESGMELCEDAYINSIVRRQPYRKVG